MCNSLAKYRHELVSTADKLNELQRQSSTLKLVHLKDHDEISKKFIESSHVYDDLEAERKDQYTKLTDLISACQHLDARVGDQLSKKSKGRLNKLDNHC